MQIVTWNMQGSKIPGLKSPDGVKPNKWTTDVLFLLRELDTPLNVLVLQEAGEPPDTVQLAQAPSWGGNAAPPSGLPVGFFSWNVGSAFQPRVVNVVWLKTDFGANRRNLAVVFDPSTVTVSNLLYVPNSLGGLPAAGIAATVSGKQCNLFSVEAFPGTGADAQSLIAGCAKVGTPWFAAGTFNRPPDSFPIPTGAAFCPHDAPPLGSIGDNEINYAVNSSGAINGQSISLPGEGFLPILYAD